jgi:hypothetical protein
VERPAVAAGKPVGEVRGKTTVADLVVDNRE